VRAPETSDVRFLELGGLWLVALAASSLIGAHGVATWDAGEYVILAIDGGKSGLLFGRPLFVWMSRLIALGLEPAHAEPVLRWVWAAASATAAPAMTVLAIRLGLSRQQALLAGVALALSPSFAHASHQVMTDGAALALSIVAITAAVQGRAVIAGLALAAAVAMRETAIVHAVSIAWLLGANRALRAALVTTAVLAAIAVVYQPPGLWSWFGSMSQSATTHGWSAFDFVVSIGWVLVAGPIPIIVGFTVFANRTVDPRVRPVAVPALVATALLLFYPDGIFSPRYVLAAVPLAFFLVAAPGLASRPLLATSAIVVTFVGVAAAVAPVNAFFLRGSELGARVPALPDGAVVVPGHFCPEARLAARIAERRDLTFICPGWGWPRDLAATLDRSIREGYAVAVDVSDAAWMGRREAPSRDAVRDWLSRQAASDSIAGFKIVKR
jgi:hypothetical protein